MNDGLWREIEKVKIANNEDSLLKRCKHQMMSQLQKQLFASKSFEVCKLQWIHLIIRFGYHPFDTFAGRSAACLPRHSV